MIKTMLLRISQRYELTPLRWVLCAGLYLCAAMISWRMGLGGTAGTLVLFALLFWLARQEWRAPSPRHARFWGGVYALALAAALTVARLVRGCKDMCGTPATNYIEWDGVKDLVLPVSLAVLFCLAFLQLRRVCAAHPFHDLKPRAGAGRCFLAVWLVIFVCWIPYLLAWWPAGFVGDGAHTLEEALASGVPSGNHWVVAYILTLRFFVWLAGVFGADLSVALCLYAVAQCLALSCVCAVVASQLYALGVPRILVAACVVMYGVSGFFASYGMALWKDTLFSAAVVLLCLQLWRFAARGGGWQAAAAFGATLLFLCFWRNNGIYVALPAVLILALVFRGKAWRLLAAGVTALAIVVVVQGPVYDALGIHKDSLTESISVPLQQIAATIYKDRPLTEEQSEFLFDLIPQQKWKETYCPCLSDDLKSALQPRADDLQSNFSEFLGIWAQLLPANLDVYVEAYLLQTHGFWAPGVWNGSYQDYFVGTQDIHDRGIVAVDWIERLTGLEAASYLEYGTGFITSGTMVWIMLGVFFFCLAKPKGRRKADLLMLTPLLLCWLSLMLAVPIAHSYRYALALPIALPLLCLLPVYDRPAGDENT